MTYAQTEIAALFTKAARGAELPVGQAASFGKAAACHLAKGRPEAQLIDALEQGADGPVVPLADAMQDLLHSDGPLPQSGAPAQLVRSFLDTLPYPADIDPDGCVRVQRDALKSSGPAVRVTLSSDTFSRVNALAERTYVPDSAESRAAGAGAGLTDND